MAGREGVARVKILRSRVLRGYVLSYLALLLVIVLCVVFSLRSLYGATNRVMDEGNRLALSQYKTVMDAHFEMLVKISEQFILDSSVQSQLKKQGELSINDRYEMVVLAQRIAAVQQAYSYSLLDDLFLYFPATDSVVTAGGRAAASLALGGLYGFGDLDAEQTAALLKESWKSKYHVLRDMPCVNQSTGASLLCVARTLNRIDEERSGVIVFLLNKAKLDAIANSLGNHEQCQIYLCGRDNRSLFSSSEDELLTKGEISLTMDSDTFDARYCLISNYPGLLSIIQSARQELNMLLILGVVVGLIVSCCLAYFNYLPIRKLWRDMGQDTPPSSNNELKDINSQMTAIVNRNIQQQGRLEDILPVYAGRLLMDFVRGNVSEESVDWDMLEEYGFRLDKPRFMTLVLALEDEERPQEHRRLTRATPLMQAVADTATQVFSRLGRCYLLPGNDLYLLLNFDEPTDREQVRRTAAELQQTILKEKGLTVTFALGDSTAVRGEMWKSCLQAERALEYAYTGDPLRVICYWELPDQQHSAFEFMQDYDAHLVNDLRCGNLQGVSAVLDELFRFGGAEGALPYSEAEMLMVHVLEVFQRAAQQMNVVLALPRQGSLFAQLQRFRHVSQFKQFVLELARNFAAEAAQGQKRDERLKNAVVRYVEENYGDPNLNVSTIADHLGVSQSYLSTQFKRQTGINASDYMHVVRIRHAKEMMSDASLSLMVIAKQAGYISDATFIRSFKKYEGITPGAYRKNFVQNA